jgi:hypothetical protein
MLVSCISERREVTSAGNRRSSWGPRISDFAGTLEAHDAKRRMSAVDHSPKTVVMPILQASCLPVVRLAHERFVGAVLFIVSLLVLLFIGISGRHRVAHDHERTPVDQPGGNPSGMCKAMLLLLGCALGRFYPFFSDFRVRASAAPFAGMPAVARPRLVLLLPG